MAGVSRCPGRVQPLHQKPQGLALTDGQLRGQPMHAILLGRPPTAGGLGDIDDDLAALNPADRLGERRDAGRKTNGYPAAARVGSVRQGPATGRSGQQRGQTA